MHRQALPMKLHPAHRRPSWRAGPAALALAAALAATATAAAADAMSGLGASFRPPPGSEGRTDGATARGDVAPGLRIVLLRAGQPAAASIDGRMVHVGDSVNGLRVTRIDAQGVTLAGEDGVSERLLVNPAVLKNTRAAPGARNPNGANGANGGERP